MVSTVQTVWAALLSLTSLSLAALQAQLQASTPVSYTHLIGNGGGGTAGSYGLQCHITGGNEIGQRVDGSFGQLLLGQLGLHALGTDLIHLDVYKRQKLNSCNFHIYRLPQRADDIFLIL